MITSRQNSKLKLTHALLGRAKERREAGMFVVEGVRLVEEAVKVNWPFQFALFSAGLSQRGQDLIKTLTANQVDVEEVSGDLLQHVSETETPQGVLAVLKLNQLPITKSLDFLLIPDQIRDPGNLGTLIRSAAAAGVRAILLPPETADPFAPKVVRSAMGAHFRLPIHSMTWEEIRDHIRDVQIYLADMNGRSCWETDLRPPLALIIGSEAQGPSEEAQKLTTHKISVPMLGKVESLNVAVAGSLLMFEVVRQRTTVVTQA